MSATSRYESVAADGGQTFDAYCSVPERGRGPGILVFQEIFGINDNMRDIADRLAGLGYVALVPDMFWRIERRFERKDESGLADAFATVGQFDAGKAALDIQAAHAHLLGLPECTGKIGAMGFCLGGGLAFAAATTSRVDGMAIDGAVCYYGSAINEMLDQVDHLACPSVFHYGTDDPFIPAENIDAVEQAVTGKAGVEFYRYQNAGHAFSNSDAPSMYVADAADAAWVRTVDFFARALA